VINLVNYQSVKIRKKSYSELRRAILKKNNDIKFGDIMKHISNAIDFYIENELAGN